MTTAVAIDHRPAWASLIREEAGGWVWQGSRLVHRKHAAGGLPVPAASSGLHAWVVRHVYAAQKNSRAVNDALTRLLADFSDGQWGLNFGCGQTDYHPRLINLDLLDAPHVHIRSAGTQLPFRDNSLDLVISQEVIEHVDEPFAAINEIHRVLKPGGRFFFQVPFIIGYHPGPHDYWRFTRDAFDHLFVNERWDRIYFERSLGHGSGFYRILVEFCAVNASILHRKLYIPAKGFGALLFYPLQWLDGLTHLSPQADRIPGGYFCLAAKRASAE